MRLFRRRPTIKDTRSGGITPYAQGLIARELNTRSGAGGLADKGMGNQLNMASLTANEAATLYRQSWAAQKLIDIPIDDMFVRWRRFESQEDKQVHFARAWRDLSGRARLSGAMKLGRLYGTGMLIIVPKGNINQLETPWEPHEIEEDGIANLWSVNRWACTVESWQGDPGQPHFGQPFHYLISPQIGPRDQVRVHHTRVIRFDGRAPLGSEGWWATGWDRDWGLSELETAVTEILRDVGIHSAIAHLVQEASVFVMKVQGFKEAIKGKPERGEPTLEELAAATNLHKSVWHTLFMDPEDDAERVPVSFQGMPELMDACAKRLAAIADIPITRFLATSPGGLNATGDSDAKNYAIRIASMQENLLTDPLHTLDTAIAAHAGLDMEDEEWYWVPLLELSDLEKAEAIELTTKAITAVYREGLVDEEEARQHLPAELWDELGSWNPSERDLMDEERFQQELQAKQTNSLSMNGAT